MTRDGYRFPCEMKKTNIDVVRKRTMVAAKIPQVADLYILSSKLKEETEIHRKSVEDLHILCSQLKEGDYKRDMDLSPHDACSLVALVLDGGIEDISEIELLSIVAKILLAKRKHDEQFTGAWSLVPKLATGIDVNVRFTRIDAFADPSDHVIFEDLGVPLFHGWIVDPKDEDTSRVVGSKAYDTLANDLVDLEGQLDRLNAEDLAILEEQCATNAGVSPVKVAGFWIGHNRLNIKSCCA